MNATARALVPAIAFGIVAAESPALAQTWRIIPEVSAEFDLTDNVDLTPSATRKSDFVTQLTPRLTISERGAHTTLDAKIAAPILLYARTGGENNTVRPDVNLAGNAELVPRLLFIDGTILVSQEYFSPFGARPQNLVNATDNRYTAEYYRIAPYLKAEGPGGLRYELRDNNIWSDAANAPATTSNAYTNEIVGRVSRDPQPLGWSAEYDRNVTRFPDQAPLETEIGRGALLWRLAPEFELSASGGYENNRYPLVRNSGAVYGAGIRWHPSDRTTLDANWEHRFFGRSYHFSFDHRTPLSSWNLIASRDVTTYPQQLANLAAGTDVATLLDRIFGSRVPDPAQRQALIDQLIRDRGLPQALSNSLALFSQQVTLQESLRGTVGLLGARNSVFIAIYRSRSEPIGGEIALNVLDPLQNNNTQTGANIVWTYKLTELYTLSTSGDWSRTVPNGDIGGASTQRIFRITLSAPLSPLTDVFAGARHQRLASDLQDGYHETAIFVGMNHRFR